MALGAFYIVWGNCLGTLPRGAGSVGRDRQPVQTRSADVSRDSDFAKNILIGASTRRGHR
jgi:hypothetical protein